MANVEATAALRALVVDDSQPSRLMLERQLQALGHRTVSAASGEAALALPGLAACHLAFIDLQLPGLDGMATAQALRQRGLDMPIYGMSAHTTPEQTAACLAAGMTALAEKPLRRERLEGLARAATAHQPQALGTGNEHQPQALNKDAKRQPQALAAEARQLPIFDRALALRNADGKADLAAELLAAFIEGLDEDQRRINAALHDPAGLAHEAHRLSGALRYCGLPRLQRLSDAVGAALRGGDRALAVALAQLLESEMAALRVWYRASDFRAMVG